MARLLVSVRSAPEAAVAVRAGADIIDVKEPDLGSLGRASTQVWREVRRACPASVPVSVALGELNDWLGNTPPAVPSDSWSGLAFRKLGLAHAPRDWPLRWARLRALTSLSAGPPWVAVAYADWQSARSPSPDAVLEVARETRGFAGVLVDTFSKSGPFHPDDRWAAWADAVRRAGLFLALAGSLDLPAIRTLDRLRPDIVAVRGAACQGGRRGAAIDPDRVAELARCVANLPEKQISHR